MILKIKNFVHLHAKRIRNCFITLFVISWTLVFHYESVRFFYLNPLLKTELPKVKFLFPPAGWIMFFQVGDQSGYARVYGVKTNGQRVLIDPHEILPTRFIGFDNIHRNVLSSVLAPAARRARFCIYLNRKFPEFESFQVGAVHYPSVIQSRFDQIEQVIYQCR